MVNPRKTVITIIVNIESQAFSIIPGILQGIGHSADSFYVRDESWKWKTLGIGGKGNE